MTRREWSTEKMKHSSDLLGLRVRLLHEQHLSLVLLVAQIVEPVHRLRAQREKLRVEDA